MEWRGLNDLREQFLSFFESKNHTRMASASLIPQGDKSLLLINSGMAPLKKFFLGQRQTLELSLSMTNVYNYKNIFYVNRITNDIVYQLPFLYYFGVTWRF